MSPASKPGLPDFDVSAAVVAGFGLSSNDAVGPPASASDPFEDSAVRDESCEFGEGASSESGPSSLAFVLEDVFGSEGFVAALNANRIPMIMRQEKSNSAKRGPRCGATPDREICSHWGGGGGRGLRYGDLLLMLTFPSCPGILSPLLVF